MKKIICVPFAYEAQLNSGVNLSSGADRLKLYLKNAAVSLCSAKHYNPDCSVVFATNMDLDQIPEDIQRSFARFGVEVAHIPFDRYRFGNGYKWALAFYKLCVLSHLAEEDWDKIAYMDTDVYVQMPFDAVWEECSENILLYDVTHGLNTGEYVAINEEFTNFQQKNTYPTHYGGEFFAASKENAMAFEAAARKIYQKMQEEAFVTEKGDEFIVSLAANTMRNKVKNASPYIHRFWTGARFRLTSTIYKYNPVVVCHMPAEKEKGIVTIYNRYISKGTIPANKKVWKLCRLTVQPFYTRAAIWAYEILKKRGAKRNGNI